LFFESPPTAGFQKTILVFSMPKLLWARHKNFWFRVESKSKDEWRCFAPPLVFWFKTDLLGAIAPMS